MSECAKINAKIQSEEFKSFCNENIIPEVKKLNFAKLKSFLLLSVCFGIYFFLVYKFYLSLEDVNKFYFGFTAAVVFLLLFQFGISIIKNYKTAAKERFFSKLLSFIGNFEVETTPDFADLVSTGLFKNCNKISCDDAIKGEFKSTTVKIYEICTDKSTAYFDSITSKCLFNGILIKLPYKAASDTPVYIFPVKKDIENSECLPVKIENSEFSSYFSIFSPNTEKAVLNIDDNLLNKMIYLAKNGHDKDLSLSIEHGEMNIAVFSNKDRFEVSFFKSTQNIENYKSVINDVSELLAIAELFIQTEDAI